VHPHTLPLRVEPRLDELDASRRIEARRDERRDVVVALVERRDDVEPHAVVERQPARELPVVLHEPLQAGGADVHPGGVGGFGVGVEHAQRGVGVSVAGVERVVHVAAEIEQPVEGHGLFLVPPEVLDVEAGLQRVRAPGQRHRLRPVPARHCWLLLAEGLLTRRLFGAMVRRIELVAGASRIAEA